jgi:hypothetical protein
LDRKRVEIDPELAKGLSQVERRLIQLYYVDDAAPERLESELGIPYEEAMRRLAEIVKSNTRLNGGTRGIQ